MPGWFAGSFCSLAASSMARGYAPQDVTVRVERPEPGKPSEHMPGPVVLELCALLGAAIVQPGAHSQVRISLVASFATRMSSGSPERATQRNGPKPLQDTGRIEFP